MTIHKILKATLLVTLVSIIGYNVYKSQKEVVLLDLAKANVEALASGESGFDQNCITLHNSWCSFVVSTPSGNWVEQHPDATEKL